MRTWLAMLGLAVVFWAHTAIGAPWDFRPGLQQQDRRNQAPRQAKERRDQRAAPQRDDRQRQHLSDEERRDLRRDLDRANRELYRRNRQR